MVNSVPLQVLLYAFVAGASPVALGATLVVLGSRGGRWNALSFALGVVIGQVLLCTVAYAVGAAAMPVGHHAHETVAALLELALGVALLIAGAIVWSRPDEQRPAKPDSRAKAVLERLAHLNLLEVFGAGAVLALGPKRLGLTVLVTATIAGGDLGAFHGHQPHRGVRRHRNDPGDAARGAGDRVRRPRGAVDAGRGALALGAQATDDLLDPLTILGVLVVVDALFGLVS